MNALDNWMAGGAPSEYDPSDPRSVAEYNSWASGAGAGVLAGTVAADQKVTCLLQNAKRWLYNINTTCLRLAKRINLTMMKQNLRAIGKQLLIVLQEFSRLLRHNDSETGKHS